MSSLDSAISSVLAAKDTAARVQIAFALEAKRLESQKQQGAAAVELLEAAVQLSKSLHTGKQFDAVG